jgi:hypothetical protein
MEGNTNNKKAKDLIGIETMVCESGARRLIKEVHNVDEGMHDKLIGLLIN